MTNGEKCGKIQADDSSPLARYRTEIIIAASTLFIIAGLYFQRVGFPWINRIDYSSVAGTKIPFLMEKFAHSPIPQFVFFLVAPLILLVILGESPKKYGLGIGDWKKGLFYVFICVAVMTPFLYWSSRMPGFTDYYRQQLEIGYGWMLIQYCIYMLSWEFLYRGFITFGLEERVGSLAIWLQAVPFAITHIGKPAPEAFTCYFGGLVLGYIAVKTRSSLYPFLIHWGIYGILLGFINITIK